MIKELESEIESYTRYENNQIVYLNNDKDYRAKDELSYSDFLKQYKKFKTIKVEGLEDKDFHKKIYKKRVNSVHLFVNNEEGKSFAPHKDDTNVYLHVIRGGKKVYINGKLNVLGPNNGIHIPKGALHEVLNIKNTWALSIGYDK